MSLVEAARLTEEEQGKFGLLVTTGSMNIPQRELDTPALYAHWQVALAPALDAQLAKALWAVVDWIPQQFQEDSTTPEVEIILRAAVTLGKDLWAAGIERPS